MSEGELIGQLCVAFQRQECNRRYLDRAACLAFLWFCKKRVNVNRSVGFKGNIMTRAGAYTGIYSPAEIITSLSFCDQILFVATYDSIERGLNV